MKSDWSFIAQLLKSGSDKQTGTIDMTPQDYFVAAICAAIVATIAYGGYCRSRNRREQLDRSRQTNRHTGARVPAE